MRAGIRMVCACVGALSACGDDGGGASIDAATPDNNVVDAAVDASPDALAPVTFDYTADFDDVANPNGVWTYGWATALGSSITTFPDGTVNGPNSSPRWYDPGNVNSGAPASWRNVGVSTADGVPAGMASMHPGLAAEYTVAIFTAPTAGTYTAQLKAFAGDSGETDATVYVKTTSTSLGVTSVEPTYSVPATALAAGETIALWIGPNGNGFSDNTPVTFVVQRQ